MPEAIEEREAAWGGRMIEVRVRFWTNDLSTGKGKVRPKHAWTSGVVRIEKNEAHGIAPGEPYPFNGLFELHDIIGRVLVANKIRLHPSTRDRKVLTSE